MTETTAPAPVKLSSAQLKTLRTIIANGGEMNGYAGQPRFYCNSLAPLERMGLVERIGTCGCFSGQACTIEHQPVAGRSGDTCYNRHRITDAGRAAAA